MEKWDKKFKDSGFTTIKRIGYLDKKTSRYLELFHFFPLESLITYKLFRKWVIFPQRYSLFPIARFTKVFNNEVDPKELAAIFYVQEKK